MSFPTRVIPGIYEHIITGEATWLKANGTSETDFLELNYLVSELLITIKEMSDTEPGTQVLTLRIYRYLDGGWKFDDSVDVVPAEKEVVTVSEMRGRMKITMEPSAETQQDYTLPYKLYYTR